MSINLLPVSTDPTSVTVPLQSLSLDDKDAAVDAISNSATTISTGLSALSFETNQAVVNSNVIALPQLQSLSLSSLSSSITFTPTTSNVEVDANSESLSLNAPTQGVDAALNNETGIVEVNSDTFNSISLTWDVDSSQDITPNAVVSVRYRKTGSATWLGATRLLRTLEYDPVYNGVNLLGPFNRFSGSIMFLTPNQQYDVELTYTDPDGTDAQDGRVVYFQTTTRSLPVKPTPNRTLYVTPGSGGGDGSSGNPFQGIDAADAAAQPGDLFKLRDGTYSGVSQVSTAGDADNHIVWEADTGAAPIVEELQIRVRGGYLWFDNIDFVSQSAGQFALYVPFAGTPYDTNDVVVERCTFTGYETAVQQTWTPGTGGGNWTVMDNTIVGDKAQGQGSTGPNDGLGWGVNVGKSNGSTLIPYAGHVVAYNTISQVGDGIGSGPDSDIFANDVFDVTDDNHTCDFSSQNVRVWGNRFSDASAYAITAQPQRCGPWYFLYNQFIEGSRGQLMKWRVPDRNVFINNTFNGNTAPNPFFLWTFSRNNLFVRDSSPVWGGTNADGPTDRATVYTADWRTDVDYDGFWYGGPASNAFRWGDPAVSYGSVAAFSAAIGIENNGIEMDSPSTVFDTYPATASTSLTIKSGSNVIGAGEVVDNLSDFHGGVPSLGAFQLGETHQFGVRSSELSLPLHQRTYEWIKH